MRISIITPTYNRATFLEQTISSVLGQAGDFELEYIVQDGGSSQPLIDILKDWTSRVANGQVGSRCRGVTMEFFVERDDGMYDAINRAFRKSTGAVMAWLNSDDMYHPYALATVAEIFNAYPEIEWLTGIPNSYNLRGARVGFDRIPVAYSRKYLTQGFYDVQFLPYGFNWIQQESTFWRRSLWDRAGGALRTDRRYASDFYLWQSFARFSELTRVESFLGGYRVHDDQITADPNRYRAELPVRPAAPGGLLWLRRIDAACPPLRHALLHPRAQRLLRATLGLVRHELTGPVVTWSFDERAWKHIRKLIL